MYVPTHKEIRDELHARNLTEYLDEEITGFLMLYKAFEAIGLVGFEDINLLDYILNTEHYVSDYVATVQVGSRRVMATLLSPERREYFNAKYEFILDNPWTLDVKVCVQGN